MDASCWVGTARPPRLRRATLASRLLTRCTPCRIVRMLRVQDAGAGAPELLLLHGLGATGDVWAGMLESAGQWPGRVVAPDLPGHGGSPPLVRYSFEALAAEIATALGPGSGPV